MTEPQLEKTARALDLSPDLLAIAGEVARLATDLDAQERRALAALALAALVSMKRGSTRLPLSELSETLSALYESEERAAEEALAIRALVASTRARAVIGRPGDYVPLIADGDHIYLQRLHHGEARFAETLANRVLSKTPLAAPENIRAALEDICARPAKVTLSDEQLLAVERAVSSSLSVISGGPGTGKTSIVVAIVRVLARLGIAPESFAIAAPTGKAANRVAESIERSLAAIADPSEHDLLLLARKPEPSTLHRLLGYMPARDRFHHHENNPLSERTVIVDESSMIDLFLMDRLTRSVRPDARLVLLGDAEQLPSVDAGTVLRDISDASLSVTLQQSFRMREDDPDGRKILLAAKALRQGELEGLVFRTQASDVRFRGVELLEAASRVSLLKRWYLDRFSNHPRFEELSRRIYLIEPTGAFETGELPALRELTGHLESFKILCVTKSDAQPTGAEAINKTLHAMMASDAAIAGEHPERYFPGEPILVVRNDYERRLFNGDQGVVLLARDLEGDVQRYGVFAQDGGFRAFHLEPLGELIAPAHAITVHKAQGSEYDDVLLLLPERDVPLLTREVLYTALTRSKRSTVLCGHRELLRRGAERRIRRFSGLADRLAEKLKPPT